MCEGGKNKNSNKKYDILIKETRIRIKVIQDNFGTFSRFTLESFFSAFFFFLRALQYSYTHVRYSRKHNRS